MGFCAAGCSGAGAGAGSMTGSGSASAGSIAGSPLTSACTWRSSAAVTSAASCCARRAAASCFVAHPQINAAAVMERVASICCFMGDSF